MSSFSALKTAIQAAIKQNGNNEITGDILQDILLSIVSTLGDSAINNLETGLSSEASTRGNADSQLQTNINNEATARQNADTQINNLITGIKNNIDNGYVYAGIATPSTSPVSGKVFYIATQAGTYTNLGNTAVKPGMSILKYNGSAWSNEQVIYTDGGVFDVSAYNGGATYASLEALLSDANLLIIIPPAVRKGGMSIKFVSSVDNKYIQARLIAQNFTTDVTQWQNVGDFLEEKEISYSEEDVAGYITDKNKSIIGKLMKSGAVEWTVKNSRDILLDSKISDIEESIQGVSGNLSTQTERIDELDENAIREVEIDDTEENVAAYITGKNGVIIGKINKDGAIERTVKNESDKIIDILVSKVNELYVNTLQESVIEISEEGVVGYVTDKNRVILAKINQDGSIDRLVENDKDKHTVHFEDVDIDDIANLLIDKDKKIIASINDKAEVDFYGGGGFAGEKIVEAKTWGYSKLIVSKNNIVIGGIKPDGTVKIFKAEIDKLNHEDTDVTALIKSLPIIASGLDNIKISNDKRVMNLLTSVNTTHIIEVQGNDIKSKLKPCISIIDDDTIDKQIPSSFNGRTPSSNQGGYFSVLLPIMLSLGAKYNKNLCPGLACEGQRVGLTHYMSADDTYSELNENGRCVKWIHDNMGWNVFNHSMTAQLPAPVNRTFYVDGINSELAQQIIAENDVYYAPYSFYNCKVLDRLTGKWYELNTDSRNAWVERTPTKKYAIPFYQDYVTKKWYFNRDFDFEYSWGEWIKRADELGLPNERVIVHNGGTSHVYTALAGRKYADWSVRTKGVYNYPPIAATVNRIEDVYNGDDNVRNASYENTLKGYVDNTFSSNSWMIFMSHFNESPNHNNYYMTGVTYPDGDPNYPSDWIIPLNYSEVQDIIGENVHDYINHPPSRLNISTWDEWYPAPGTKVKSFYDVLDYALSKGVEFVSPMEGWSTHGNILNIGVDRNGQVYDYPAEAQTPYTEAEQSFLTIGADGSIRYYSK